MAITNSRKDNMDKDWIRKFFSEVYVVCIPERRKRVELVMKKLQIAPVYVDAVLTRKLRQTPREQFVGKSILRPSSKISFSELACALSHKKAIDSFLKTHPHFDHSCLIFEDDVDAPGDKKDLEFNLSNLFQHLPPDWGMLNLGRCWDTCCNDIKIFHGLVLCQHPLCLHAYALTNKFARIVQENLLPLKYPVDNEIVRLKSKHHVKSYCATPPLFYQNRKQIPSALGHPVRQPLECGLV